MQLRGSMNQDPENGATSYLQWSHIVGFSHSVLVGNALCWLFTRGGDDILEFDMDRQSLGVIQRPSNIGVTENPFFQCQVLRMDDGGLGLAVAVVSNQKIQVWSRKAISYCAVGWVLQKTIELDKLVSLSPLGTTSIVGVDEDSDFIFLKTVVGVFMIRLKSLEFLKLPKDSWRRSFHPYRSFCGAGNGSL